MESADQFYVSLPSSASMDLHPNNKISDFTTQLLNNIYLESENYEVGLSEILLDTEIENVQHMQKAFVIGRSVKYVKEELQISGSEVFLIKIEVGGIEYYGEVFYTKGGLYNSLSDLMAYFNKMFARSVMCKDLVFRTTKVKHETVEILCLKSTSENVNLQDLYEFYFHIGGGWLGKGIRLANNDGKTNLLAFKQYLPKFDEYLSNRGVNFEKTIHFICDPDQLLRSPGMAYIYSNIVGYQAVGDTLAPLLRVVHFPENKKAVTFTHIHYVPLNKTTLNSIRIYTRDVEGRSYPFNRGTALFLLHFKKRGI